MNDNNFFIYNKYHENTKHSYNSIRLNPNRVDWNNPPDKFKFYPSTFKRISLGIEDEYSDFLYLIAGITAKKTYPNMEYYLRVNPSAGALYPNELYFQARNVQGLEDGIYHFEVGSSSIVLLEKIDVNSAIETNMNLQYCYDGFIFFISSIYFRSSWKYKNRAFRYCLLDAGHIIGSIEASCYIYDYEFEVLNDFDKKSLNSLFNFDEKEFFTSAVICKKESYKINKKKIELNLPTTDGSYFNNENPFYVRNNLILEAYNDSSAITNKKIESKRAIFNYKKEYLKEVILKRRSIREFTKKSITRDDFETIYNLLMQKVTSDCEEEIIIFFIINRVDGMENGLYKNNELLKLGDFSFKAGYLCLEQDLGSSSAVTFFITSKGINYQVLYQKAGLIGHRLYLAANYLNIGCSGIGAYYDDEVCEFIEENTMVLYALAIGN